jgi:thioredoxin reductase
VLVKQCNTVLTNTENIEMVYNSETHDILGKEMVEGVVVKNNVNE